MVAEIFTDPQTGVHTLDISWKRPPISDVRRCEHAGLADSVVCVGRLKTSPTHYTSAKIVVTTVFPLISPHPFRIAPAS